MKEARIIELGKFGDRRGNLTIVEQLKQVPFEIKRAHWMYDVPGGVKRGAHAFKTNEEFIIALSGSFDVILHSTDSSRRCTKQKFSLNRSYYGLLVPAGYWREMENFSTNSLALVLSSEDYDENDYIMEYDEFLKWKAE